MVPCSIEFVSTAPVICASTSWIHEAGSHMRIINASLTVVTVVTVVIIPPKILDTPVRGDVLI